MSHATIISEISINEDTFDGNDGPDYCWCNDNNCWYYGQGKSYKTSKNLDAYEISIKLDTKHGMIKLKIEENEHILTLNKMTE